MKGQFLSTFKGEPISPGSDNWRLLAELAFSSEVLNRLIIVPEGFVTDFASVPRLPLAYLLFGNVAREAAVVHDFLYSTGACSRKLADDVFAEASKACNVAAWRRGPMWFGVRLFGWWGNRYRAAPAVGAEQNPAGELERKPELE